MDYAVERLSPESGGPPVYQLVSSDGLPLMIANQSSDQQTDERRQLRLSRPDGKLIATIDLPAVVAGQGDEAETDYAIIHDFAVYAILGVRRRPATDEQLAEETYFTLEVEGEKWIALPDTEHASCYALYDEVPDGLHTYDTLTELDLPPFIGRICRQDDNDAFRVELSSFRLQHGGLIILALAYLMDRPNGNNP